MLFHNKQGAKTHRWGRCGTGRSVNASRAFLSRCWCFLPLLVLSPTSPACQVFGRNPLEKFPNCMSNFIIHKSGRLVNKVNCQNKRV